MNEFDDTDMDAELVPVATALEEESNPESSALAEQAPKDLMELRERLVSTYHEGAASLIEKLRREGRDSLESLVPALVEEIISETDSLLGNELVATRQGSLRDASIISFKRSEVIGMAIKAVQAKQQFERESGLDVNSPSLIVVFKYFMGKVKQVMDLMETDDEFNDTFFRMLGDAMDGWKKELKEEFDEINRLGGSQRKG